MQKFFKWPKWFVAILAVTGGMMMLVAPAHGSTTRTGVAKAPQSGGGDGCNPGRSNNYLTYYFDGADSKNTGGTPGGVYATISNYSPYVSGANSGDETSEWVMLDEQPPSTGLWVQIGWLEEPGSVRYTWDEYSLGSDSFHDDYYAPFPINSKQKYTVLYQPGNEYPYVMEVNGQEYNDQINIFTPDDAQIFAEIHTQASQIPGGTQDPSSQVASVTGASVWPGAGSSNGWQSFDGYTYADLLNGNPAPSWVGEAPSNTSGNTSWRTWDTACKY